MLDLLILAGTQKNSRKILQNSYPGSIYDERELFYCESCKMLSLYFLSFITLLLLFILFLVLSKTLNSVVNHLVTIEYMLQKELEYKQEEKEIKKLLKQEENEINETE